MGLFKTELSKHGLGGAAADRSQGSHSDGIFLLRLHYEITSLLGPYNWSAFTSCFIYMECYLTTRLAIYKYYCNIFLALGWISKYTYNKSLNTDKQDFMYRHIFQAYSKHMKGVAWLTQDRPKACAGALYSKLRLVRGWTSKPRLRSWFNPNMIYNSWPQFLSGICKKFFLTHVNVYLFYIKLLLNAILQI